MNRNTTGVHDLVRTDGWSGFFRIGVYRFSHERFDGSRTPPLVREVFERGQAAAVLPYDPITDEVLLIRQFLIGAELAGIDNRPLQVVAGMIEPGEAPQDVARREAMEESGVELEQLITGPAFLPSPGGSSERIHTFVALVDLKSAGGYHGLAAENEDIEAVRMPATEAISRLDAGEIEAGPAVVLLNWFARHRETIRGVGMD